MPQGGSDMSLHPQAEYCVPAETARVAKAIFLNANDSPVTRGSEIKIVLLHCNDYEFVPL